MPPPASQALIAPGAVFAGDYRIDRLIGQGGMAQVFAAEQLSTGKLRALKLMHPTLVADDEHKKRFLREARAGGRIESDHVVSVQGAGVDADTGTPYIVMELLRGETLYDRVKRGPVPAMEAAAIVRELGHAIAAAHVAGVVHRDLKPENVFLATKQGASSGATVKVLDFGIAKLLAEVGTRGTTGAMGSPLWMAPEQTEPGTITPAADVWAMGLLVFYLLTGKYFWLSARDSEATVTQLLREIIFEPIPRASERAKELGVRAELPAGMDEWALRCLQRDPSLRFANGSECTAAFEGVLSVGDVSIQATVPGDPLSLPKVRSLPPSAAIRITPASAEGMATIVDARSEANVEAAPTMEMKETVSAPPPGTTTDKSRQLKSGTPPPLSTSNDLKDAKAGEGTRAGSIGPWMLGSAALVAGAIMVSIGLMRGGGAATTSTPTMTPTMTSISAPTSAPTMPTMPTSTPTMSSTSSVSTSTLPSTSSQALTSTPTSKPHPSSSAASNGVTTSSAAGKQWKWKVSGHTIFVQSGRMDVVGNVAPNVIREAMDWNGWEYLRCYERDFTNADLLPHGTITLKFKVFDQLPRDMSVEKSDFAVPKFNECVRGTAVGQTVNAAGANGFATVSYALTFTVGD